MKRTFTLFLAVLFSATVFGQTTEYSVQLGSGFFSFRGNSASSIYTYSKFSNGVSYWYENNPYGQYSAFSYSVGFQVQRITKWHFIYGLQADYESLSSRTKIKNIVLYDHNPNSMAVYLPDSLVNADSHAILTNKYFTLHPFLGIRMKIIKGIKTDLTLGTDFAFCTSSEEHVTVNTSQGIYNSKINRDKPHLDTRLRVDLTNYYKHFGLTVGYSYGLTNYESGMNGVSPEVYSQMIRLGLAFKL